jgi:hypothetical protein
VLKRSTVMNTSITSFGKDFLSVYNKKNPSPNQVNKILEAGKKRWPDHKIIKTNYSTILEVHNVEGSTGPLCGILFTIID